jgi:hypothetical protein
MEQPIAIGATDLAESEDVSERDIVVMLSMLDYLIGQVGRFDGISAHCLVLARKALAAVADRRTKLH